jgi:hypothetical protein
VREIGHRVKRWQSGTMVLRWTATGVLEAERGFRKLAGYRAMPILVAASEADRSLILFRKPAPAFPSRRPRDHRKSGLHIPETLDTY